MAGQAIKRNLAKSIILNYLSMLYSKKTHGVELTQQEIESVSQKKSLAAYVLSQDDIPLVEPGFEDKQERHKGLTQEGNDDHKQEMSLPTIYAAIDSLRSDKKIDIIDGQYQYIPSPEEKFEAFPILKIADSIRIAPLLFSDMIFFKVDSQYSEALVNYINQQLPIYDIYAISLGSAIVCGDLKIPAKAKSVAKKCSFKRRLGDLLAPFYAYSLRSFNDDLGLTQTEVEKREQERSQKTALSQALFEEAAQRSYGGSVTVNRKIKRTNQAK